MELFGADLGNFGIDLGGIGQSIWTTALIILLVIIVGMIVWIAMYRMQFKHKFRLRDLTNGNKIIIDDNARIFTDNKGVIWWQLWNTRIKVPVPPPQVVETTSTGTKSAEAYRTPSGEIVYIHDTAKVLDVPREILSNPDLVERNLRIAEWREKNRIVETFQPYTANHRTVLVNEHMKAQSKITKKWQDYILPVAGLASMVILVVSLMIFYADMAKPLLEMADKQNAYAQTQVQQIQLLQEIKNDVQSIKNQNTPSENHLTEAPN